MPEYIIKNAKGKEKRYSFPTAEAASDYLSVAKEDGLEVAQIFFDENNNEQRTPVTSIDIDEKGIARATADSGGYLSERNPFQGIGYGTGQPPMGEVYQGAYNQAARPSFIINPDKSNTIIGDSEGAGRTLRANPEQAQRKVESTSRYTQRVGDYLGEKMTPQSMASGAIDYTRSTMGVPQVSPEDWARIEDDPEYSEIYWNIRHKYGITPEQYQEQQTEKINARIEEALGVAEGLQKEAIANQDNWVIDIHGNRFNAKKDQIEATIRAIKDVRNDLNDSRAKYGKKDGWHLAKRMWDRGGLISKLAPVYNMIASLESAAITAGQAQSAGKMIEDPHSLTPEQQLLHSLTALQQSVGQLQEDLGGKHWASTAAEVIPEMAEFMMGMPLAKGATKAVTKGATKVLSKVAGKTLKEVAENTTEAAVKTALESATGWHKLGSAVGAWGKSFGEAAIGAPTQTLLYRSLADEALGQYQVRPDGSTIQVITPAWERVYKAWLGTALELHSEDMGMWIGKGLNALGRRMANVGFVRNIMRIPASKSPLWEVVRKEFKVADPFSEAAGEIYGDAIQPLLTGDLDWSDTLGDEDYWKSTVVASAGVSVALNLPNIKQYKRDGQRIQSLGRIMDSSLEAIENDNLRKQLITAVSHPSLEQQTKALATINWGDTSREDMACAMDYVYAHTQREMYYGAYDEVSRQEQLSQQLGIELSNSYRGESGRDSSMTTVKARAAANSSLPKDAKFYVIAGDYTAPDGFVTVIREDQDGSRTRDFVPVNQLEGIEEQDISAKIAEAYDKMFSEQIADGEVSSLSQRIAEMRAEGVAEDTIREVVSEDAAYHEYKEGDVVTDKSSGETVTINEQTATGEYIATKADGQRITISYDEIADSGAYAQQAQESTAGSYEGLTVSFLDADGNTITGEVAQELGDGRISVMVQAGEENGAPVYTGYTILPSQIIREEVLPAQPTPTEQVIQDVAQDVASDVAAVAETTETPQVVAPQAEVAPDAREIPTLEDGSINYDAIEDPQQFIDLYGKDMATEELIADVTSFRDDARQNAERLNAEATNAKTPNEKKALRDQAKIEANRANKYQAVLDLLMPTAPVAEQVEVAPEVAPVAEEAVEPTAEVAEQTPIAEEQMEVVAEQPTEVVAEQTESPVEDAKPTTPAKPKLNISEKENKRRIPLRRRANLWGRKVGVKVVSLESLDEVESKEAKAAIQEAEKHNQKVSGWVDEGKVYLYLPHVDNTDEIDATYIHEVVAHIGMEEMMGEKEYQQFCLKVWDMMNEQERDYYYTYEGVRNIKNEEERKARAADEYIAHLAEQTNLEERDATMWEKIVDLFSRMLQSLGYPKNISRLNIEDAIRESYRNLIESNVIIEDQSGAASRLANKGALVDAKRGDVKFAVRDILKGEEREQAIKDLMRVTGRNRATVEKYLQAEESLAAIILDDRNKAFLDVPSDESVPSIWENSDFPQGTVEFSNICRKRLPLTMIYQRLQKEFPNTVFDAATLETIRGILKNNGFDVACGLCFVEDRRQHLGEIGQGFIDALKGKDVKLNNNQQKAIEELRASGDTYIPTLEELLTLEGMRRLKRNHYGVAVAFIKYNKARGQMAGRLFEAYSAYHREILKWSKAKVDKANRLGGLRIFSYSDFEAHHLIDIIQVLTDCAVKGVKVQAYTKVPEFALVVKDTRMKLNRSLIAKAKGVVDENYIPQENEAVSPNVINGKRLLFDCVEGINVNSEDFFDSTSSPTVGNILVGINDEQIHQAMLDPMVDYIIPFHTGIKREILEQKGIGDWVNYKKSQTEKEVGKNGNLKTAEEQINVYTEVYSDNIRTEKEFVERYLEVCREKGYTPKFSQFLNKNDKGEFVYTKGYYKFLVDFKLFDVDGNILPQEVVVPLFNNEVNKRILDEYVEGEKTKAPTDKVYNEIKEALRKQGTIRYRFIGEKGAANLDKAEEATIRLDDLNTARQMEEAQKNPKTIKMATGWERGADGKWRYEENDTVTAKTIRSLKGAGVKKIREARSQRIKQLDKFAYITHIVGVDQLYDEAKILATSWSEEQKKMWLDIYNMFKDDREGAIEYERKARAEIATLTSFGQGQFMLYEVLGENDSIFKAYPEMRNVKFWLKPYKGGKTFGGYNRLNNTIEVVDFRGLFENDKGEGSASTAAHEIQHIIQGYEGFARGGNMSMLDPNKESAKDTLVVSMTEKFNESMAERDALWEQKQELDRKMENWWLDHTDATSEDMNNDPQMREWNKQYDEIIKKHNEAVKNVEFFKDRLDGAEEMDVTLGEEGYKRLAGEVEARNVERRRNMSMMERRNSPAWETEDVARKDQIFISDALESEKAYTIGNNEQTQSLNAKQKNPSQKEVVDERDIQFRISKNNRTTINGWMNKRSDLTEADKGAFLDYIDDLDSKTQLVTGKWFANGVIRVPEDMPKVEQAIKVATIAKVDPLQYKSPMELIDRHADIKVKEKPIDPDTVDTLFDRHEVGNTGIVTYEVEESEESRANMRKIINTHFGDEASPWCLLQGDGKGNLTQQSRQYWDHYNAYPKRVAFKDGKLLAFSANSENEVIWWDRQDEAHVGIPVVDKIDDDELGRSAEIEYNQANGEVINVGQYFKGNKQNGTYERWSPYDDNILIERSTYKDGKRNGPTEMWSYEGYPESKVNFKDGERDGESITYAANGKIVQKIHYKNGLRHGTWEAWNGYSGLRTFFANYTDGALNGHYERWYSNGRLAGRGMMIYDQKDGLWEEWDEQGRLTSRTNYNDGLREGLCEIWANGILRVKALYKGGKLVKDLLEEEGNSTPRFRVTPAMDNAYMDAVERGDMAEAQRMVDEAAKAAGYDSPILYSGTDSFGFTVIDANQSDDKISFWATNDEDVAGTYTMRKSVTELRETVNNEDIEDALEELNEKINDAISDFRHLIDRTFSEWYFGQQDNQILRETFDLANSAIGEGDGIYDKFIDIVYDAYYDHKDMLDDPYEDANDWLDNSESALRIVDAIANLEGLKTAEDSLWTAPSGGIMKLYASTEGMHEIDCKGANWNNLRPDELPERVRPYKTREVVKWAEEKGWNGVVFKNVRDSGKYGTAGVSNVYAFIKPFAQVKSADPVTYDNNGNVIPLSERFNNRESDIRFRVTSAEANQRAYNLVREKLQNAGIKVHEVSEEQARQMAEAEYMIRKDGDISMSDIPSYINRLEKDAFAITEESSEEDIFDVLKRLSELNASAYKGYGELTIEQNNANVSIYRSKNNILRHLVGVMANKGLDVSAWNGVLYYRHPNGIQLSYHVVAPQQGESLDYIPESIVKPTGWDGVRMAWRLSPDEYARKVEERRAKIDADNLLMQDRVERIKAALLKVMKNGSLARKYGIGKSYADIKATDVVVGFNNDRSFQGIEYIIGRLIESRTPYRIEQLVLEQLGYDSSREEERYFEDTLNLPPTRYFYRTNGTIYGWAVGGEIHLAPQGLNANTAIHEYSHLWVEAMRKKDPRKWSGIKEQLKATPFWQQVLDDPNYANIRENEDSVASEVLARLSGNKGAERLANEAQRIIDAGNGNIMARVESTALVQRVKRVLRDFYAWVARNVFGLTNEATIARVADMVVDDLLNEVSLANIENSAFEPMFIGENGALNLDIAERVTNRVNNFDVALQMDRANKSIFEIKLATGWERGADGAWRYELDDSNVHLNMEAMTKLNEAYDKNDYRQRNEERIKEFEVNRPHLAERRKELIEKYSERSVIVEAFDDLFGLSPIVAEFELRDFIDYDEAFDAYPQLRDITVRVRDDMSALGQQWGNYIDISVDTSRVPARMRSTLLHEIQHAIQGYEGFAAGGNSDIAKGVIERLENDAKVYEFAQKIKREMERFHQDVEDASIDVVNDMVLAAQKNKEELIQEGLLDLSVVEEAEKAVQNPATLEHYRESWQILHTLLDENGKAVPYKAYRQLMGEVEARNTARRRDMTAEERSRSVAMSTEDTSRENQILRYRVSGKIESDYPNWLSGTTTESGKHSTQVEGTRKTYSKVGDWIETNLGKNATILDASSGMGYGTADLRARGFNVEDVEPYQSVTRKHNNPATYSSYEDIDKQYDYIISNAVLNVIPDDWRTDLLHTMAQKMKVGGKMFINTRKAGEEKSIKDKIELDTPQEVLVKRNGRIASYQRFFTPNELMAWVQNELGDDYNVEVANKANSNTSGLAAVVVTKVNDDPRYRKVYFDAEGNPVKASPISTPKKKLESRPFRPDSKAGRAFDALWRAFADSQTIVGEYVDGLLQKIGEKEIQRRQQKTGFGFTKREMESLPARIRNKFRNANPIKAYNNLSNADQIMVAKVLSKFNPLIDYMSVQNRSESRGEYEMRSYIENHINPLNEARQRLRDVMGVNDLELEAYVSGEHSLERHKSGIDALAVDEEREWSVGKVTKLVDDFHKRLRNNVKRRIAEEGVGFFSREEREAMGKDLYYKMEDVGFLSLSEEEQNKVLEAPLELMWNRIRALNDAHLQILLRAGRYSKEDIDRIKSHNWKYYVPLYGHDVAFENLSDPTEVYEFAYRAGSPSNNISFKKAEGRSSKAQDIFLNMYQLGQRCIAFEARNNAKRALLDFTRWTNNQLGAMGTRNLWYEKLSYQVKGEDGKWHSTDAIPSRDELAEMRKLNQQIGGYRLAVLNYNNRINSIEKLTETPSSQDVADKLDAELQGLQSKREEALRKIEELEEKKTWDVKRSNGFDAESPSTKDKVETDRTIKVWADGREVRLVFNDPDVARAVNGTKVWAAKGRAAKALRPIAWLTRARAQFNTQFSPDFIISNSLRDFQHALIAMALAEQGGVSISFMKNYVSHIASAFRSHAGVSTPIPSDVLEEYPIYYSYEAMRSAYLEALKEGPTIIEEEFAQGYREMVKANRIYLEREYGKRQVKDTLLEAFRAYGGATGFVHSLNEQAIQKQFREAMLLKNETIVRRYANPVNWARGLANIVSVASETMEDITRFATFLSHLDRGKSVEEAAQEAKEITTNFNRKGELSSGMGTLYMFFNASIQGSAQVMRLIKQHPRRAMAVLPAYAFLGFAQRITKGMLWKALAFWTIRGLLGDDDELRSIEQLENEVQIPDYIYGDNMIFTLYRTMDALDEVATSGYFLRIPQPNGFRAAYKVGVELGELALGQQSLAELPLSMASTVAGELLYGYSDTGEIGSDLGRMFIPSFAQPVVDLFLNRDFVNRTIYNERTYKPTAPTYSVAKKGTPQMYVEMSKALNNLLGGTDTRSADYNKRWEKRQIRLDIPPEAFEYMVSEMFGGLGTFSNRLMTTVELMFKGEDVPLRKIPFVNRVAGEFESKNVWPEYKALTDQVDLAWQETAAFRTEEDINMTRKEWKDPAVTYPYMIEHYKDDPNMVEMLRKRWLLKDYFKEVRGYSDALKSLGEGGDAVDRASEKREMTEEAEALQADRTITEKYILEVAKHVDWQAPTNEEVIAQLEEVENKVIGD